MSLSAFDDETHPPRPAEVREVLGRSAPLWDALVAHIEAQHPPVEQLWNFGGAAYGWTLRLRQKGRVILYLTPLAGSFQAGLVLGDKAVKAARAADLPEPVLEIIHEARKYAEGTGLRIPVTTKVLAEAVEQLAALKMAR